MKFKNVLLSYVTLGLIKKKKKMWRAQAWLGGLVTRVGGIGPLLVLSLSQEGCI